jgi:hypothetical protein
MSADWTGLLPVRTSEVMCYIRRIGLIRGFASRL